ncbi:MAG: PASTA domain-containing protein [Lachnospiraceae bacterium]|nr:PASTA domain-containing protein [Lachnospiraceae bacterium]
MPEYGNWKKVRRIGRGSFGTVYEIEQKDTLGFLTRSALKVIYIPQTETYIEELRSEHQSEEYIKKYFYDMALTVIKEVKLMDKVKGHTNVVGYLDHEARLCEDGISWEILIRMELLTPLREYSRKNKITRKNVIELGIAICNALELCQKYKIIHRDIKPGNILVTEDGEYKLSDFGIARSVSEDESMASMSQKGTYPYMAPEVYRGKAYGYSVDLYSLGIVMYQLLNYNRDPFLPVYPKPIYHGDREAALQFRMQGRPLPLPAQDQSRLAEIVLKACSFNPEDRYSNPGEMKAELKAILNSDTNLDMVLDDIIDVPSSQSSVTPEDLEKTVPKEAVEVKEKADEDLEQTAPKEAGEVKAEENGVFGETAPAHPSEVKVGDNGDGRETGPEEDADLSVNRLFEHDFKSAYDDFGIKDNLGRKNGLKAEEEEDREEEEDSEKKGDSEEEKNSGTDSGERKENKKLSFLTSFSASFRKKAIIVGAAAVLLGITIGAGRYVATTTKVPDVTNMAVSEAEDVLEDASLTVLRIEQANSDEIDKGKVIKAEHQGQRIKKNSEIILTVSRGAKIVVTDKKGTEGSQTAQELSSLGLIVKTDTAYSEKYAEGKVMEQSIKPNSSVEEGAEIILTISLGKKAFEIKSYTKQDSDKVKKTLEKQGLKVTVKNEYSSKVKKGAIIRQSVKAGKKMYSGDQITLVVSKGTEQVKVPSLGGLTETQAREKLKDRKLTLRIADSQYSSVSKGKIISQMTASGKMVDVGSRISVVISRGLEPETSSYNPPAPTRPEPLETTAPVTRETTAPVTKETTAPTTRETTAPPTRPVPEPTTSNPGEWDVVN